MTKYQLIVLALLVSSILTAIFGATPGSNKGIMSILYKLFAAITLLLILLIGYRAFFLIR
jgi:hypothetical protein